MFNRPYQQRATRQGLGRLAADLLLKPGLRTPKKTSNQRSLKGKERSRRQQGVQLELFPSQLIQHYL
jgi:hypothetical protein